jgi:hypothetical protein
MKDSLRLVKLYDGEETRSTCKGCTFDDDSCMRCDHSPEFQDRERLCSVLSRYNCVWAWRGEVVQDLKLVKCGNSLCDGCYFRDDTLACPVLMVNGEAQSKLCLFFELIEGTKLIFKQGVVDGN